MPVGIKSFVGERLIQARTARGLTAINLSSIADISASSISLYEKGAQKPKQEILDRIAGALNIPVGFFMKEIGIERPNRLFYRSMSSTTKSARVRTTSEYEWALEVIDYLLEYFDFPIFNLPDIELPNDFRKIDTNTIESIAYQVRAHWNLGVGPVSDMVRTLESNGIIIWRTAFEVEKLDAFSEYREPHPVVVLASDKENYFRSRFDAAHELGHLILHSNIDKTALNKASDFKIIENQAHLFAGAFLLPAISYSKDLWSPSLDAFRSLKPRWNVSIGMQIMRCRHLKLINENEERRLWINLARRKWKRNEPLDDSTPVEKPTLINSSIRMLIDEKVKSKEQLLMELSLSSSDLEKIGELPHGYMKSSTRDEMPSFKKHGDNIVPFNRGNNLG